MQPPHHISPTQNTFFWTVFQRLTYTEEYSTLKRLSAVLHCIYSMGLAKDIDYIALVAAIMCSVIHQWPAETEN